MKRLRNITAFCLTAITVAVIAVAYNLTGLYYSEKERTLATVRECAANSDLLEMVSRMESGERSAQSFIRLNLLIESAQQKDGRLAVSDTVNTSLANLMRIGLEFADDRQSTDFRTLDSIFIEELHRHGLYPQAAMILPAGSEIDRGTDWWMTKYVMKPQHYEVYDVYVSPMPGEVLSHMWGIIIPVLLITAMFGFLSFYLIRTVRRLRTIEQMKDDFTHNMTHELKTPVAVAYSAADSMLRYYDQSDDARNRKFLAIIIQRLSYLSGMIENILSMSMERFSKMKLNIEHVELKPLIEEIAGMIRLKAEKPVSIDTDIPDGLTVMADSLHLGNVISNLLDNAVKYSGQSVSISIKADSRSIFVEDDGIGIDREDLPHIFDKFYRVGNGDRLETGGYGLGLFYVSQIVALHGWNISVKSKPGQGTRFTINFK